MTRPVWLSRRVGHVLGLAATYYVAGSLGLLLATSPGDPTVAYPAAGIALAWWVVPAAGLLVTGLLGAFLLVMTGRATKVETGRVIGAATIARDVTDRKALERMKDEFIGTVSHELRTPLAAIKGFVELVADGEAGPVTDTQREFLEISSRNADRLTALINDLLDVNRMEASGLELREDPVDLADVLGDVAATFRPAAQAKGLEFRADAAELPEIIGDRDRLIQVFNNLVSNAIKYTPRGEVGIVARVWEGEVEILVWDTGIGLSPEEQAYLFTKFFRGGHRIAREAGGTGLGLVIAKAIVERHSGRIAVESEPGAGTRFRVFLPLPSRESVDSSAAA